MSRTEYSLEDWFDKEKFEDFDHKFVIAGGCLRDGYFNKDVVDVDVFIWVDSERMDRIRGSKKFAILACPSEREPYLLVTTYDSSIDKDDLIFEVDGDPDYPANGFISGRCAECPGLNVILREDDALLDMHSRVEQLFKEFPCSISKIAYSPMEDELYVDPSFYESVYTNTIQFYDASEKYVKKIIPKYGEFKQVYNSSVVTIKPTWTFGGILRSSS